MIERVMGVIPSPKDLRDYKLKAYASRFPATYVNETCLVKDQGSVGSCVAHSTAEVLESYYGEKLSTDFIYGMPYVLWGHEGPGMMLRDACKIIQKYGDPNWEFCYTNTEVNKVYGIAKNCLSNDTTMYSAHKHKISSYVKLNSINDIKFALQNYGPVIACVEWYKENNVYRGQLKQGFTPEGYHCVLLYGWDEDGFFAQNSWGTSWGKEGKCVIPYNYVIQEAYGFTFEESAQVKKPIKWLEWLYKIINRLFK